MAKVELSKEIEVQEQPVFADVTNGEFFWAWSDGP